MDSGAAQPEAVIPVLEGSAEDTRTAKIMMADDEAIMMDLVQVYLEEAGYNRFIQVEEPALVIETLAQERPDVLLLDLVMPKVSGFDILRAMRSDDRFRHLPVIILTASSEAETKLKALELGATDFLAKPVDPSELVLRLRNTLEAKAYQDQLAYYDSVTGLPNRKLFVERLEWALRMAKRQSARLAVARVALQGFRKIDNTLGRVVANQVLEALALRVQEIVRDGDELALTDGSGIESSLSYLSGEQFSVLLPNINTEESASLVSRRISQAVAAPINIDGNEISLSCHVGIAVYPNDGEQAEELLRCAGEAVQQVRPGVGEPHMFYSSQLNERSRQRLELENLLRHALERDELVLHYQPKVDVQTHRIKGVEALLRWQNPERGMINPVEFIPLAEETGMIIPIGQWVISEACRQARQWRRQGLEDLHVAVNVSPLQLEDSEFISGLKHALDLHAMPAEQLTVELTESQIMDNVEKCMVLLKRVRDLGCRISIDDFGTGYSSLSYLRNFPVDELKIDRSFIIAVHRDSRDAAIVKAIISLARGLDLSVVCEGVEEAETTYFLKATECNLWQGFLCSKPVSGADFLIRYQQTDGLFLE